MLGMEEEFQHCKDSIHYKHYGKDGLPEDDFRTRLYRNEEKVIPVMQRGTQKSSQCPVVEEMLTRLV